MILNRAKDYYENGKERLRKKSRDKYKNLSEEEKSRKGEYGKTDTTICLKEKNKDWKNIKNIITRLKSCNTIIVIHVIIIIIIIITTTIIIVFQLRFNSTCYLFSCKLLNIYIYVILDKLTEIKAQ